MSRAKPVVLAGALLAVIATSASAQASYRSAIIENHTEDEVSTTVRYLSCKADNISNVPGIKFERSGDSAKIIYGAKEASSKRGLCLISSIEGHFTTGDTKRPIDTYTSSGTSYQYFMVMPTDGGGYRIYSKNEYTSGGADMSPGFEIINKTPWDVEVMLSQVGCLYYGKVPANGGKFRRKTGAVWFTIKAHILPDGKPMTTDKDCITPVAAVVGGIFITAVSAGTMAKLGAFTAAAGTGAVAAKVAAAKMALAGKFIAMGSTASTAIKATTGIVAGAKATALMSAKQIGDALQANGSGELKGQFAGYEWPFRCNKMPTYEITGGWGGYHEEKEGEDVVKMGFDTGTPLKITKINDCGNKMNR